MKTKRRQSRTPTASPQYFANKLFPIYEAVHVLCEKDEMDERDFAVAMEHGRRYIEILDEILASDIKVNTQVVVHTEGQSILFPDIEAVAKWIKP